MSRMVGRAVKVVTGVVVLAVGAMGAGAAADTGAAADLGGVPGEGVRRSVGARLGSAPARVAAEAPVDTKQTAPRWSWPVPAPRVVAAYAAPASRYTAGHRGIDLTAAPGDSVTAPADATVHFAGIVVDRPVLTLDHGDGVLSSFEPLSAAAGLTAGQPVARGAPLGAVGEGAHCSGTCLHVGVRIDGEYVSPLLYFDRVPRSVLLPLGGGNSRGSMR